MENLWVSFVYQVTLTADIDCFRQKSPIAFSSLPRTHQVLGCTLDLAPTRSDLALVPDLDQTPSMYLIPPFTPHHRLFKTRLLAHLVLILRLLPIASPTISK